jgi:hypothetical protein
MVDGGRECIKMLFVDLDKKLRTANDSFYKTQPSLQFDLIIS